jgi:hypothetical protein
LRDTVKDDGDLADEPVIRVTRKNIQYCLLGLLSVGVSILVLILLVRCGLVLPHLLQDVLPPRAAIGDEGINMLDSAPVVDHHIEQGVAGNNSVFGGEPAAN